jgi:hypothetical protein
MPLFDVSRGNKLAGQQRVEQSDDVDAEVVVLPVAVAKNSANEGLTSVFALDESGRARVAVYGAVVDCVGICCCCCMRI